MTGGQWFGWAVTGLGDVNNDNVDDFAVSENGTARIYFGGTSLDAIADLNLTGQALGIHYYGNALAGGSDLDDDGYPDIVVSDYYNDVDYQGRAYIYNGGPALDSTEDYLLMGGVGVQFGRTLATGGDLDNDGIDDLVISTPTCYWNVIPGKIQIYKGGAGFGGPAMVNITGSTYELLGQSLAIDNDMNGDGIHDLMAGAPADRGKVYFYWGRTTWPVNPSASATINGEKLGDQFGFAVTYAGDMNNDGKSEVVVGAPFADPSGKSESGKAYFINGSASPSLFDAIEYPGPQMSSNTGHWVEGLGEIDDDGLMDFAVSTVGNNSDRGSVELYHASYGIKNPVVKIGSVQSDPLTSRPIFNGTKNTFVPVLDLQNDIDTVPSTVSDAYGNPFVDLTVDLRSDGAGSLTIKNIKINYTAGTSAYIHLEDSINSYLEDARATGTAGDDVAVPIAVKVGSNGRLVLSNLVIDYTANQVPEAIIDSVSPVLIEVGENITMTGHGIDDGAIISYNWSSDLDGLLGNTASVDCQLTTLGTHTISFRVQDDRGRWSPVNTTTVTVVPVNLAPAISIDEPVDGSVVHGGVMISGNASDPNSGDILSTELKIDDGPWQPAEGITPWTYFWNTANETDGVHMIHARASDGKLFSPTIIINVTVIHPAPGITITSPADVEAYPGDTVALAYSINNPGTGPGTFFLAASSKPSTVLDLETKSITLDAGGEVEIQVDVRLDNSIAIGTVVVVELSAKEVNTPDINTIGSAKITIKEKPPDPADQSVVLEGPADGEGKPGETMTYRFTIRNTGTAIDSYLITVSTENDWKTSQTISGVPAIDPVDIRPGESVELLVTMKIPDNAKAGKIHKITVTIESTNFQNAKASAVVQTKVLKVKDPTTVISVPWVPLITGLAICCVLGGVLGGTEWGKYGFFWLLIPLYSRLKKEAVLDNFKRGEINAFIRLNPGTYYNEIKKHLGISNGVLTYHLNRLEQENYIRSKNNGRYKHYFPADMKIPERIIILNELQRGLLKFIRDNTEVTQAVVSDHLDLPVATVSRHLKRLLDADLIAMERRGNLNYYRISADTDLAGDDYHSKEGLYAKTPPEY
jgi:predicted transcriptional regulator